MHALSLLGLLGLGAGVSALRLRPRPRADAVQLYAYGTNISGLRVYAGSDNMAYVASDSAASNLTSLTWSPDATGTSAWTVTMANASRTFYVVADTDAGDAFKPAGFVANTSSAPTGAVTTGFVTYGPYVMLLEADDASDGDEVYVSEFWARTTSTDGVWSLMWNENGTSQTDSVPVSVKITAPDS